MPFLILTLSAVTGIELSTAILLSAAIVIGYTVLGGLWSVAYTNVGRSAAARRQSARISA